jgi:hypothetical protein
METKEKIGNEIGPQQKKEKKEKKLQKNLLTKRRSQRDRLLQG